MSAITELTKAIIQPDCRRCQSIVFRTYLDLLGRTYDANAYRGQPEGIACDIRKTEPHSAVAAIIVVIHLELLQ